MINLACGVIRISIKCSSCLEIFDQQESFKLDMIDLACGVIRISNNVLALRYSINKVIRILFPLYWFLISSFGIRASGSRSDICFLCVSSQFDFYLFLSFLVFNLPRVQNSIFALFTILRGENESFICVHECKQSGLKFLEHILLRECCEVRRISITYFLQQSYTNRFEDESSWRSGEWYEPGDINHTIYFNEDVKKKLSKLSKDVSIHATLKKNEV